MTNQAPVLIGGQWRPAHASGTFRAQDPSTGQKLDPEYPVSSWADAEESLACAVQAARVLRHLPGTAIGHFLDAFAKRIEANATEIVAMANRETALPSKPRLADVELPRTTGQLRQAAAAARQGSWALATIDTKANIRSCLAPLGPVAVFGPNNFPLAFNSVAGGDFAAAIASGNPVIAKANSSHSGTTRLLAEAAVEALRESSLPPATVQMFYRSSHDDGVRLVADHRIGATAYTGSRGAGLALKTAADAAGKPIYLELSSVNPVVFLPGALLERGKALVDEFVTSSLMGTGQFCTNPGMVILIAGPQTEAFIAGVREKFEALAPGVLLSTGVAKSLGASVENWLAAGAHRVTGGSAAPGSACKFANTLMRVSGQEFLTQSTALQVEAFGNAALFVVVDNLAQAADVIHALEGNLTGCIYSANAGTEEAEYAQIASALRPRVGRLLNDRMPTGVAVSPAMNHGGPFPATGHPGFTAVGIPASMRRFGALHCYDQVRPTRLPPLLQDRNPCDAWRLIDGQWTQTDVTPAGK